jgi:ABC-type transport system involved in multi-copper enzyme maturation permease subunit
MATPARTEQMRVDSNGPRLASLVRAELFKLRSTNAWWMLAVAVLVSTVVLLVVDAVNAHGLLGSFSNFIALHKHDPSDVLPADFVTRLHSEWLLGHSAAAQASVLYTASQMLGLLLVCLLGIVMVTSEFQQRTATTTFLVTPRRDEVIRAKLVTAVLVAVAAWAVTTIVCVVAGAVFLHTQGFGPALTDPSVLGAIALNLVAYVMWAVLGVGFGAMVRNQLGATVTATVMYLAGAAAAVSVFELLNTYVIQKTWVLAAEVIVPTVASTVMISPTATWTESPPQWVGAVVLLGYATAFGVIGVRRLRTRDIA